MAKKRSEAGAIIAYFSMKPLDQVDELFSIVSELVRRRKRAEKPKVEKKPKAAVAAQGGSQAKAATPTNAGASPESGASPDKRVAQN